MAPATSHPKTGEFVYIDLDERSPWWTSVVAGLAVIVIVAVLIAPWAIDWDDEAPEQPPTTSLQSSGTICRPNSAGLPGLLDPSVASWSRFCEWFIDPSTDAP